MSTDQLQPRVTSFAPQFLVDHLNRSISYYDCYVEDPDGYIISFGGRP